ncbi:MAG: HD domain-containing phosphohydrolase, partial [Anaerolineales bacterium]
RRQRRQASAELGAREARARALLEHSHDAISMVSAEGRLLYVSPSTERMLGYASQEMIDTDPSAIIHPDDLPTLTGLVRTLVADPQRQATVEYRVRHKDGSWRWLRASISNLLAHPAVGAIIFNYRDVTERVRAVEALTASEAALEAWTRALDLRGQEAPGHTQRVTELALRLAVALGVAEEDRLHIRRGALLHDIGHLGVPESVLLKPGPLDPAERQLVQQHPGFANDLLMAIPALRPALAIPYGHHEKWDGSGYPGRLQGTAIPIAARLFAVVDVWDALQSPRPQRSAWSAQQAAEYLRANSGSHFDPHIVEVFLGMGLP